jgi:hypothetical protein
MDGTDDAPLSPAPVGSGENRLYRWLEGTLFRWIISYTIHPLHIFALLLLWIGLLVIHHTVFELVGGNYTNGLSAMAASIVLLQQTRQHREVRRITKEHRRLLGEIRELLGHRSPE